MKMTKEIITDELLEMFADQYTTTKRLLEKSGTECTVTFIQFLESHLKLRKDAVNG
jgi:hypothetical protein